MRPNREEVAQFLRSLRPDGPWIITAISAQGLGIDTVQFGHLDKAVRYVTKKNVKEWNIYFSVNATRHGVDVSGKRKLRREDIGSLDFLHVDVDPVEGRDLEEEQKRILAAIRTPPKGIPEPTFVVFSGGGYQAFWRLAERDMTECCVLESEERAAYPLG